MSFQAVTKQQKDKHVIKNHNDVSHKPVNPSNQIVQRKPTCPSGGGCPECMQSWKKR